MEQEQKNINSIGGGGVLSFGLTILIKHFRRII